MTTSGPSPDPPSASFEALFRAYAAELPRWFSRLRVPPCDVADASQEVWLELQEHPEQVPTSQGEARLALFTVAARIAQRFRRRAALDASRRHPTTEPEHLAAAESLDDRMSAALTLLDAFVALDEFTRRLVIASKVLGHTDAEIARAVGLTEASVQARIWRTCTQLATKRDEHKRNKRRGALLLPGELVIDPEIRAAMAAILS
ncbi:RNA polymerase sigma factor, partial [Polyangium mundeleinium]